MADWIFLSPHADDAVYSCGGLIWELTQPGAAVEIWTMCAGDIPAGELTPFAESLHTRWGADFAAAAERRQEDQAAARIVGAECRFFPLPDCIYRRLPDGQPVIHGEEDLWREIAPGEQPLVERAANWWRASRIASARVVSPLALGSHVDHRLTRAAAEQLGRPLLYYADYPYALRTHFDPAAALGAGWMGSARRISPTGVAAWQQAVAQYRSQLSTFWASLEDMRVEIAAYAASTYGTTLWRPL